MNLAGGYLEGEAEPEVAFLGCFRQISFRTPPDFADVPTNYTYSEPTRDCAAVAPDGRTVVAGDAEGQVYFLRLEKG